MEILLICMFCNRKIWNVKTCFLCKTKITYTVDRALYCMFEKQHFYDVLFNKFLCDKYNIKIYIMNLTKIYNVKMEYGI